MSKSKFLKQRYDQAKKAYEVALLDEQKRVGALVMQQYEKGTIKDQDLIKQIAKLLGDDVVTDHKDSTSASVQSDASDSSVIN